MLRAVHVHICKPLKTYFFKSLNHLGRKQTCNAMRRNAFVCRLLTISGHDAQGHEGIASNELVVVCDEYTERIQSPKAQQGNLVLVS